MYTYQEQCTMDLSDNYTLLYSFLCREVLDEFGLEGERALREGTRRYGRDRGLASRKKHQALGVKVNMQSLFGLGGDLPPDPRFRRELQELDEFINNTSLRLSLRYEDRRIELPGDMYASCWESHDLPPCDILKLPHHGHKDALSPRLLQMLRPAHTVISVSNTRTDLCPHPEAVGLLRQMGSRVYFTDAVRENGHDTSAHSALRVQISGERGLAFL